MRERMEFMGTPDRFDDASRASECVQYRVGSPSKSLQSTATDNFGRQLHVTKEPNVLHLTMRPLMTYVVTPDGCLGAGPGS